MQCDQGTETKENIAPNTASPMTSFDTNVSVALLTEHVASCQSWVAPLLLLLATQMHRGCAERDAHREIIHNPTQIIYKSILKVTVIV